MKHILMIVLLLIIIVPYPTQGQHKTGGEFVPRWAKGVVWYQIFPERFRNGDTGNDPKVTDIAGADPAEPPKQWQVHPWGSDWYKLQPYEQANGEPELWKHLLRRRYGGDLQGVIDKLDYLQWLGITAIYLNPVFMSPSLHKYDGASYHHIDPSFGPDPEGDRKMIAAENPLQPETWVWTKADELALQLIKEAHKRNMRIIFDGVFNHLGVNSFAFQDLKKRQQNSPYKDWFTVRSWDDSAAGTKFAYEGWWGVKSLPELKEDEHGLVSGPKEYIFNATRRWMNPRGQGAANGIDGWRLDVAFCVGHPFWKDWRKLVKSINPEAYLTAEIVDKPEKVKPYLQGDEFDAEMNYNFAFTCAEFFIDSSGNKITAAEFVKRLTELRELYPKGVADVCQNLFGSHDANRIASHIVNRGIGVYRDWGRYFGLSQAAGNPNYNTRKPEADEITLQKLFVIFQMTYAGAPMVYYGDEKGMWGANDPDCRKPMIWEDISYEVEKYNPFGAAVKHDSVTTNSDLLNHYRTLIGIRNNHEALRFGSMQFIYTDDASGIVAFERKTAKERVIVVLNNSDKTQKADLQQLKSAGWRDLLSGKPLRGTLVTIPQKWGLVLVKQGK